MEGYNLQKEMSEAIQAGENALCSLRAAREELQKAGNWGIVDLFGGGFITNLIKHSKMDNASHLMENAKYDLKKFQKELRDVTINTDLSIDCGGFLTFADFFWDGVLPTGWYSRKSMMQSVRSMTRLHRWSRFSGD